MASPPAAGPSPDAPQSGPADDEEARERRHFADVVAAMQHYRPHLGAELARRDRHLAALPPAHRAHLPIEAMKSKHAHVRLAIEANARFLDAVSTAAKYERAQRPAAAESYPTATSVYTERFFEGRHRPGGDPQPQVGAHQMSKVITLLHTCVRDWSEEGAVEREQCHRVLLDALHARVPPPSAGAAAEEGAKPTVLFPGSGLGRIVFEAARAGYWAQGNEFSFHMLLAGNFLLNRAAQARQFPLFPRVEQTSNVRSAADQARCVRIPDVCPATVASELSAEGGELAMSMVAGEFLEVYDLPSEHGQWNAVVTCFFLDTAPDPVAYIDLIYRLLRPGGWWINFGPLLYHWQSFGSDAAADGVDERYSQSVELTLEEVMHAVRSVGFTVQHESSHRCTYAADQRSMMQTWYDAALFCARKPE